MVPSAVAETALSSLLVALWFVRLTVDRAVYWTSQAKMSTDMEVVEVRPGVNAVTIAGTRYEVSKRYRVIKAIGHGAYGVVVYGIAMLSTQNNHQFNVGCGAAADRRSADDMLTGKKVAIKKIPNAFNDLTDAKRILREIKLMRHFDHENVRLSALFPSSSLLETWCRTVLR